MDEHVYRQLVQDRQARLSERPAEPSSADVTRTTRQPWWLRARLVLTARPRTPQQPRQPARAGVERGRAVTAGRLAERLGLSREGGGSVAIEQVTQVGSISRKRDDNGHARVIVDLAEDAELPVTEAELEALLGVWSGDSAPGDTLRVRSASRH